MRRNRKPTKPRRAPRKRTPAGKRMSNTYRMNSADEMLVASDFIDSMVNPERGVACRVPDNETANSAVFHSPFVDDLGWCGDWDPNAGITTIYDGGPGYATVGVFPGTTESIWRTLGNVAQLVFNTTRWRFQPTQISSVRYPAAVGDDEQRYISHALIARDQGLGIIPRFMTTGRAVYEISLEDASARDVHFAFAALDEQMVTEEQTIVEIEFRRTSGTWFGGAFPFTATSGPAIFSIPANTPVTAFSVRYKRGPIANFKFSIYVAGSGFTVLNGFQPFTSTAYDVLDSPGVGNLELTTQERPTALSLLMTFTGSALKDGGVVASARLPAGMSISDATDGDHYRFLASLPTYNYDGPVKDGSYAWWRPESVQEFAYAPYREPRNLDLLDCQSLWSTTRRDDPEQGIRMRVHQNFEVLTRSILYPSMLPPVNVYFPILLGLVGRLPAVTENPFHKAILAAWRRVRSFASKPKNWARVLRGGASLLEKL